MKKLSKKWWVILIVVVLIIVVLVWFFAIKKDSSDSTASGSSGSSSKIKLIDCTNTASTQPSKYATWYTSLIAAPLTATSPYYATAKDNGVRSFSGKDLKAKTSPNTVYYIAAIKNESHVPGTKSVMEICNKDNKSLNYYTTATTTTTPSSENAIGITQYLHSGQTLPPAGTYRIDGYLYADGAWHFTDRLTGITLTN